jgi:hypothetical protein
VLRQMTLRHRGNGLEARLTHDTKPDLWKNDPATVVLWDGVYGSTYATKWVCCFL